MSTYTEDPTEEQNVRSTTVLLYSQTSVDKNIASMAESNRDFYLLLAMPIAAYWTSASIFYLFDRQMWYQQYKIHAPEAGEKRNRATLPQVFRQVVAQQVIQVVFALVIEHCLMAPSSSSDPTWPSMVSAQGNHSQAEQKTWFRLQEDASTYHSSERVGSIEPSRLKLITQLVIAIVVADFWQYLWHRIFHSNKFLYSLSFIALDSKQPLTECPEYVHAVHHRIYVPYSYGALYSSLIEAFIVDTIGTTITFYVSGLPTLPAMWFATLSIIKSVNDHSGYRFPYNPFDYLSTNTTDFHDVHHQAWGMKYHFSQVYLTIWVGLSSI